MSIKRFLRRRRRKKEMDKAFETIVRRNAVVNLRLAEAELSHVTMLTVAMQLELKRDSKRYIA